jgi:hypothetical protein
MDGPGRSGYVDRPPALLPGGWPTLCRAGFHTSSSGSAGHHTILFPLRSRWSTRDFFNLDGRQSQLIAQHSTNFTANVCRASKNAAKSHQLGLLISVNQLKDLVQNGRAY